MSSSYERDRPACPPGPLGSVVLLAGSFFVSSTLSSLSASISLVVWAPSVGVVVLDPTCRHMFPSSFFSGSFPASVASLLFLRGFYLRYSFTSCIVQVLILARVTLYMFVCPMFRSPSILSCAGFMSTNIAMGQVKNWFLYLNTFKMSQTGSFYDVRILRPYGVEQNEPFWLIF